MTWLSCCAGALDGRHLGLAWAALARPQVYHHDLAAPVGQRGLLAAQRLKGEVGRGEAGARAGDSPDSALEAGTRSVCSVIGGECASAVQHSGIFCPSRQERYAETTISSA